MTNRAKQYDKPLALKEGSEWGDLIKLSLQKPKPLEKKQAPQARWAKGINKWSIEEAFGSGIECYDDTADSIKRNLRNSPHCEGQQVSDIERGRQDSLLEFIYW